MTRVELTFDGNSRGAVGAARDTVQAVDKVKRTVAEQAQQGIAKRLEERRSLQALAAEYTRVATTAKRGSEQQVAAFKLEQQSLRQLNEQHAVHSRRLQSSTRDLERFGKGALIGSGALGHLGRTAAIASGSFLGGVGLIQVFRNATHEGSLLSTQLERTSKVFGQNAADIKKWSKDSVDALGLARSETLLYAADIGQLLVNMKLAPAAAAAMSKGLLQRAADVATQKSVPTGDVVGAFTAAINGQTRGLREYGIALDNAMVKREAERLGLVRNTVDLGRVADATMKVRIAKYELGVQEQKHGVQSAEAAKATLAVHAAEKLLAAAQAGHAETLTKAQRAQATYNAILDQTGKTAGYIAKHQNDLTVQTRKLHAEEKQLFEILGTGLIPMLVKYLPHLTAWIDKNEKNGTFQREFNKAIGLGTDLVHGAIPIIKAAAAVWKTFADAVGGSANAIELLTGLLIGKKLYTAFATAELEAKGLRAALLGLGDSVVLGVLGGLAAAVAAVLASSGDAPNVPSTANAKGKAGVVADLAKAGKFTDAQMLEASAVSGISKDTPFGRAMKNPKFVNALYQLAAASGLLPKADTGFRSGDLGAPGANVAGVTGPITSGLAALEKAAGGHVNDDFATKGHAKNSYHYRGQAADLAPDPVVWAKLYARKDAFAELFGPTALPGGGLYSKGVQFYNDKLQAQHQDHIHVAYTGGVSEIDTLFSASATTTTGTAGSTTGGTFTEKPKPPRPAKILSGTALLDHALQVRLATALGSPGTADDLRYLKEARVELERLQKTASKAEQVPIAKELANVNRQITAIDTANLTSKLREIARAHRESVAAAKAAFQAQKTAWQQYVRDLQAAADAAKQVFETSWQSAADRTLSAFDDITTRQLTSMGKATSAQMTKMQRDAAAAIAALQVTVSGSGFASFLFGGPGARTPTEILLAQRSAAKQTADDIQSIADAKKNLADAQTALASGGAGSAGVAGHAAVTLGSGDTVTGIGTAGSPGDLASLQQAVADAQKQLDAAIYQQETDDLQTKAQLERDAADKALTDAQNAFQDQADLQQQAYQDRADAAQQAYQDQRTAERQNIADWLAFQEAGLEAGTIQWTTFYAQLVALAGANGFAVGAAFWGAWQDAQNAGGPQRAASQEAALVASFKPVTVGSWQGLVDPNGVPVAAGFQGFDKKGKWTGIGGFAAGGFAGQRRPVVDPRDTIPAMLRRGEYVMTPEEVAAGAPRWARGGNGQVGDVYLDGKKVGTHVAPHVTNAQERQIGYQSPRG